MDYQKVASRAISDTRVLRQKANEWTAVYFAVAMLGLVVILTVSHSVSFPLGLDTAKRNRGLFRSISNVIGNAHSALLRKVPLYPSLGHAVIFFVYLFINVTLCFHDLDWSPLFGFAARLGWMAACNIALVTFLALKNTPLAFLTTYSYERLNSLHQMAGYCTVIFSLLHAVVYTTALSYEGTLTDLLENSNIMGIVAGSSMLVILATALILRKRVYELFYVMHISLFMLILIAVGMHRPNIILKALLIVIFAASIWISDRVIRLTRITWYAFSNSASITPISRGGMRIVIRRTPRHAVPGSHVFLWIPKIRATETHPFTIVATNPLELVVSAHDGFTKDLFSYACKDPGAIVRASIDGPYGTLPNFSAFGQIILIAGGSGASFTFGVATNLVKELENSDKRPAVNFIWVVREQESLTWYNKELEIIHASPMIRSTIHITRLIAETSTTSPETAPDGSAIVNEKVHHGFFATQNPSYERKPTCDSDIEKSSHVSSAKPLSTGRGPEIRPGRPDIGNLILNMVGSIEGNEKTVVAVCGPQSLMLITRSTVASIVRSGHRNITLHCEQFGW